jgi:hypothetical protein
MAGTTMKHFDREKSLRMWNYEMKRIRQTAEDLANGVPLAEVQRIRADTRQRQDAYRVEMAAKALRFRFEMVKDRFAARKRQSVPDLKQRYENIRQQYG